MNSRKIDSARRTLIIGSLCAAVCAAVGAVLYFFAYHSSYDTVIRHYETGAVLPTVFGLLMLLSAVIFSATAISMRRLKLRVTPTGHTAESFGLWLCAFMFLLLALFTAMQPGTDSVADSFSFGKLCSSLITPLALLSSASFFLALSRLRGTTLHAIFSLAPVLWSIDIVLKYYFDLTDMTLNDPELSLTMVSLAGIMLLFLGECRLTLGIASAATVAFSASAALFLTGGISLARAVLFRTDALMLPTPAETAFFISAAILGACRLISLYSFIGKSGEQCCEAENAEIADEAQSSDLADAE